MLDARLIGESFDLVQDQLARRGFSDQDLLDRVAALSGSRRDVIARLESQQQKRNANAQAMAKVADKKSDEFAQMRAAAKELSGEVKGLEEQKRQVEAELHDAIMQLPNLPHESTPAGLSESDNVELRVWGEKPTFEFAPRDHVDLGTTLGLMDFDRAAKISGARFVVLRGLGARLERALMQFMLDLHSDEHGYTEIWAPVIVKDTALEGTGQLPKFAGDSFRLAKDEEWEKETDRAGTDLYLIPTAEVSVTNLHAGEILESLPVAYTAYSACFRSEAGAYGKDTRGMIRNHQFDKVELIRFVHPDEALEQHALLTSHAEAVLQKLGLHYRVIELCCGDISFSAKKCFDLEVWLPGQNAYREISSCSWFGDFQARRMKTRFRPAAKAKPQLLHTINGSGLAIGRTLVALLEQNQNADGSVRVPPALQPYLGGREVIAP